MQIIKHISVDVAAENIFQSIIAKQHDSDSRFLTVQLTNEGNKIVVDPTASVLINAQREDGSSSAFSGNVNDDGTITVPITSWMLALDGQVECDISIIGSDESKLTSTSFTISVEEAVYSGEDIADDENYGILVNLIAECREATEAAKQVTGTYEVEQSYDPTSTKALSGVAVAQAIRNAVVQSVKIANVFLVANDWVGDGSPYSQVVTIEGVTTNSKVDLQPSIEQLNIFHQKDLTFVAENKDGIVTVYVIGQKPQNDYYIQVTITEVAY